MPRRPRDPRGGVSLGRRPDLAVVGAAVRVVGGSVYVGSVGVIKSVRGLCVDVVFPGGGSHLLDTGRLQLWNDVTHPAIPLPPVPQRGALLTNLEELLNGLPKLHPKVHRPIRAVCVTRRTYKFLRDDLLALSTDSADNGYSQININSLGGTVNVVINAAWPGEMDPASDWEVSLMDSIGGFCGRVVIWNPKGGDVAASTLEKIERAKKPKLEDIFEARRKKARWNIL